MSLRSIELLPSADIHLSEVAPHDRTTLEIWIYDDDTPPVQAPDGSLSYELRGHTGAPGDVILSSPEVSFDTATRVVTGTSRGFSFLRIQCVVDGRTYHLSANVTVHRGFPSFWLGNNSGTVNRNSDNFVVSVFAETGDAVAVDVTGHGFVELTAAGGSVHPVSGRVSGHSMSAGDVITVSATENGEPDPFDSVRVKVADEIGAERRIVEPLFSRGAKGGRRNLLFLAEGFKADEKYLFLQFARRIVRRLTRRKVHEPFRMLRKDYRIWTAFEPSEESGVTVCARVDDASGELSVRDRPISGHRLLQARDSAFGLSYGNRAGEFRFGTQPQPIVDPLWYPLATAGEYFVKDWRRMSSDHGKWMQEALAWFSSLRTVKGPERNPDYTIGTRWGHEGDDQGLILIIVNDEKLAANYLRGDGHPKEGFLFATANNRTLTSFTVTRNGASRDHVPGEIMFEQGEDPFLAPRIVEYRAMHEIAHAFFLGDEYEGNDPAGRSTEGIRLHDNLDDTDWIDAQGPPETKWNKLRRANKASKLLADAQVLTPGTITIHLPAGEGEKWIPAGLQQNAVALSLRTRNINFTSDETFEYHGRHERHHSLYPKYRDHLPLERIGLLVESRSGDTLVMTGDSLQVDDVFPAGSALIEPVIDVIAAGALTLVLPGVLAHLNGSANPLHRHPGPCADADDTVTVYPPAGIAQIVEPTDRERLIGLYEGGGLFNCQVYRPSGQCMLRNQYEAVRDPATLKIIDILALRFCHVCRYSMVNEIEPARHPVLDKQYPGTTAF